MASLTASKLNLKQCLAIQANHYRSSDNKRDYQAEEIEDRINEIRAKQSDKANKAALKQFETAKVVITTIPTIETTTELVTEINEYWKISKPNGSYEFLAIPPQIMSF